MKSNLFVVQSNLLTQVCRITQSYKYIKNFNQTNNTIKLSRYSKHDHHTNPCPPTGKKGRDETGMKRVTPRLPFFTTQAP